MEVLPAVAIFPLYSLHPQIALCLHLSLPHVSEPEQMVTFALSTYILFKIVLLVK